MLADHWLAAQVPWDHCYQLSFCAYFAQLLPPGHMTATSFSASPLDDGAVVLGVTLLPYSPLSSGFKARDILWSWAPLGMRLRLHLKPHPCLASTSAPSCFPHYLTVFSWKHFFITWPQIPISSGVGPLGAEPKTKLVYRKPHCTEGARHSRASEHPFPVQTPVGKCSFSPKGCII